MEITSVYHFSLCEIREGSEGKGQRGRLPQFHLHLQTTIMYKDWSLILLNEVLSNIK